MADHGAPLVLGTMNFGRCSDLTAGMFAESAGLLEQPPIDELLAAFAAAGGTEIDSARIYQGGNTDLHLGASPVSPSHTTTT